jgi:FMN phosphatase YigB (HAD superfamily)
MKPKPIIFIDFDGTLCFDKYWRSLPPERYEIVQSFIFGKDSTLVNDWMKGKYTAEEINHLLAEKMGVPYEELWALFVRDCETMQVSLEVLEDISSLRDRYTVILITGNMDSFTRFTVPALHLDQYFDYINNSFFAGKLKDDSKGAAFMEYAKSLGVSITDCFLIDNSLKACESFTDLGGTSYLITPERQVGYFLKRFA